MALIWLGIKSSTGIVVFCLLFGFFSGSFVSLFVPVVAGALCPNLNGLGVRLGMLLVPSAVGLLIGDPIAGAIRRSSWLGLQVYCAVAIGLSTLCLFLVRFMKVGMNVRTKV